jgi:hypothetical protein
MSTYGSVGALAGNRQGHPARSRFTASPGRGSLPHEMANTTRLEERTATRGRAHFPSGFAGAAWGSSNPIIAFASS